MMATTTTTRRVPDAPSLPHVLDRAARRRLTLVATAAFLVVRVLDVAYLWLAYRDRLRVGGALTTWDGDWFVEIARHGYPTVLPVDAAGTVRWNAYGFLPLYPALIRALHEVTGLPLALVAIVLNVACGLAATVLLARLMGGHLGERVAAWGVVLFAALPGALVLGMAYSEGLFLLGLVGMLHGLAARRSWLVAVGLAVAGLSRGAVLPLVVVLVVHLVDLVVHAPREQRLRVARVPALLVVEGAALVLVPLVVPWVRTGRFDALARTQASWNVNQAPHTVPDLVPWIVGPQLGDGGWWSARGLIVAVTFVTTAVGAVLAWRLDLPWHLRALAPAVLVFYVLFLPPVANDLRYFVMAVTVPFAYAAAIRLTATRVVVVVLLLVAHLAWASLTLNHGMGAATGISPIGILVP